MNTKNFFKKIKKSNNCIELKKFCCLITINLKI